MAQGNSPAQPWAFRISQESTVATISIATVSIIGWPQANPSSSSPQHEGRYWSGAGGQRGTCHDSLRRAGKETWIGRPRFRIGGVEVLSLSIPMSKSEVESLLQQEPFVRSLARTLVADDADDIVQQTFVQALTRGTESVRDHRSWLARIVHNVVSNSRRSQARRLHRECAVARVASDIVPSSLELMEREERRATLVHAVDGLPDHLRAVVFLRFFEDHPPRVIARELQLPVVVVKERLRSALAQLRNDLERENTGSLRAWLMPLLPSPAVSPVAAITASSPLRELAARLIASSTPGVLVMTTKAKITIAAGILVLATLALTLLEFAESDEARNAGRGVASDLVSTGTAATSEDPSIAGPTDEAHREVVDPVAGGTGAGSLTVRAVFASDRMPAAGFTLTVGRSGGDPRVGVRRAKTDASGAIRFDHIAPGRTSLRLDRTSVHKTVEIRAGEDRMVELVVQTGLNIRGVVVDESDVPVAGAEVHFAPNFTVGRDMIQIATSGPDGRFMLRDCYSPCLLGARAEDFAPSRLAFRWGGKGTTEHVRLVLRTGGGSVEGLVLGPGDKPVADAVIRIGKGKLSAIAAGSSGVPAPPAQTTSGQDGRFRAIGIAAGEHPVAVRAPGLAPWSEICRIVAGETARIRVVLREGVIVRGTVRDDLGLPVDRVGIWFGESGALDCYTVRSAADGTFTLRGLPSGKIELVATHRLMGKRSTVLHGVAGGSMRWDFFLQRGIQLRGRVMTKAGDPVRAIVVVHAEPRDGAPAWLRSAMTDGEGRFTVINCPAGRRLTVVAKGANVEPMIETITRSGINPEAGEVVLRGTAISIAKAKASITGRVVGPNGEPIVNATVWVRREGETGAIALFTGADGVFKTQPLETDRYRVSVQARGYPYFSDAWRELTADALLDIGKVRLVQGGTVRIRSIEGGADDVRLSLHGGDGGWKAHLNPTVLPVRSQPLVPGTYQLQLKGKGIAAQLTEVVVRAGQETIVDMRLHKGVERRIELAFGDVGLVDLKLRVRITSAAAKVFDKQITGRGQDAPEVLCSLEPGSYRVTAENAGWIGEVGFTVTNGGTAATIEVAMRKRKP
jgi:RNA polymerase sigma factor (sigma-70 family)